MSNVIRPVESNTDFVALEHRILGFWEDNKCFDLLREKNQNGPVYRFIDGPITANNAMGVHHAWGRTLKDVFLRRKAMSGYTSHWQNGFDSQGLWVEVEVERELGFASKGDIEAFGVENFIGKCKERVARFSQVIVTQSVRLGQWMNWPDSYFTHTDDNIEGIWHFLNKCHANGWIYQDYRILPWCPRCGTSLSEHEMAGSYQNVTHESVYIQLPLVGRAARIVAWTTTPWTLPANVALAVKPDMDYCEVLLGDGADGPLILAQDSLGVLRGQKIRVQRVFKGAELVGLEYETCFPDLPAQQGFEHRVIAWDMVDPAEGTGVVHIAPGCGLEDYELGKSLGLPVIEPVNEFGNYFEGFDWLTGLNASAAAEPIIERLEAAGKLLRRQAYEHSYPVCWRCKTETIFRLVKEWFIRCDEVRPRMIAAAQAVKWKPDYMARRMEDWLNNMGDWNISRKRFYGLPLPFYPCGECGELTVVGSKAELRRLGGEDVDGLPELHRPWIDQVKISCPKCARPVARIPEVGDVWLDAGIVPYTTLGYFHDRARWERFYPAEWITEMREQVRLWFYSMLFMGVTLHDRAPYEEVLAYESVVAEDGTKFSKTGYMIRFDDAAEKMGADVIRYLFCSAGVANKVRFGYELGEEVRRRLLTFWNVYSFFVTYARLDRPDVQSAPAETHLTITDRWLITRTNFFLRSATAALEAYSTPDAIKEFENYVEDLSNWYVRVNRRRFWKSTDAESQRAAYWCLYRALRVAAQVMAPIIPFMAEEIWQNAVRPLDPDAPLSVHLSEWPKEDSRGHDESLIEQTAFVRNVASLAHHLRKQEQIKVRQPLAALYVIADEGKREAVERLNQIIADEVNVKSVQMLADDGRLRTIYLGLDFKQAGAALKQDLQRVKELLAGLDETQSGEAVTQFRGGHAVELPGWPEALPAALFKEESRPVQGIVVASAGGLTVALETRLSEELTREGLARDVVRHVQVLRKESGLRVDEHISLGIQTDSAELAQAVSQFGDYIAEETLAASVSPSVAAAAGTKRLEIGGHEVQLTLAPVS